jgi:hypothetical protein
MRLKIARTLAQITLLVLGLALLALGFLAYPLGLDNDPGWGRACILAAAFGAVFLLVAVLIALRVLLPLPALKPLPATEPDTPTRHRAGILWAGLGALLCILACWWYLTAGTFTTFTPYSRYFDRLADAFLAGKTALLESPPPELLALPDPYDWQTRAGIGYLWDASLFQGHYYYYWGPAPALLAALVKAVVPMVVDDQFLVLFFCAGLAVCLAGILATLRSRLYPAAPPWTLLPLTLLGGLSLPVLWLVNRPSVYETAIAGGQFFLLLGLLAALRAVFTDCVRPGWLLLAGAAWGAAVNCRLNLALVVIFFTLMTAWLTLRSTRSWRPLVLLLVPLVAWAIFMGSYNFARFGSIFETGHRYQLTGPALPANYAEVVSPGYVLPNFYNYLLRPPAISRAAFPFITAPYIEERMWPSFLRLPAAYYYSEPVTGLLVGVPAVWLAFLPLLGLLYGFWRWLHNLPSDEAPATPLRFETRWIFGLADVGSLLLLAPLLMFIASSMRYLADAAPLVTVLSALGLWWGLRAAGRVSLGLRAVLAALAVLLVVISLAISLLANFDNGDKRFEANNPSLLGAIQHFFDPFTAP